MDKEFVLLFISKVQSIIEEMSRQQESRQLVSLHSPSRNRTMSKLLLSPIIPLIETISPLKECKVPAIISQK